VVSTMIAASLSCCCWVDNLYIHVCNLCLNYCACKLGQIGLVYDSTCNKVIQPTSSHMRICVDLKSIVPLCIIHFCYTC
jgi:hypothetical protein